jgi:hypothetical protein
MPTHLSLRTFSSNLLRGKQSWRCAFGVFLLLCLTGCAARPEGLAPIPNGPIVTLSSQARIGQSFSISQRGLQSISLYVVSVPAEPATLRLHLRASPQSLTDLAIIDQSIGTMTQPGFVTFPLPMPAGANLLSGYFEIEILTGEPIRLAARESTSYMDGSLYLNGAPADGQLVFLLGFDVAENTIDTGAYVIRWLGYLLAGLALFLLPGLAIIGFWPGFLKLPFWEKVALGFAPGLALAPVLLEFANLIGWQAGIWWIFLLIGSAFLILGIRYRPWTWRPIHLPSLPPAAESITLAVLLAMVMWTRIEAVRSF